MKPVDQKDDWNLYVMEHGPRSGAFLQSWEWGNAKMQLGYMVDRLETNEAKCLVEHMPLPLGKAYGRISRGPVGVSHEAERDMVALLKQKREHELFLRVDASRPVVGKPTAEWQPAHTLITNLQATDDELLAQMHSKTRYNIRLAERKGVEVMLDAGPDGFDAFIELTEATYRRHKIGAHSRKHYEAIMDHLDGEGDAPMAFVAIAKHGDDVLAANMMIDWNGTRTYLHGASSDTKKNLMAPYLLHWKLMQHAKLKGLTSYDWWGTAPPGVKNHPWSGVTRFKKGFGGEGVSMPTTVDVVIDPLWYGFYKLAKRFRK